MSSHPDTALSVFVSYSHRDELLRDALATHLARLEHEGTIHAWHDRRIDAGRERQGEIDTHLEAAELILLLISPDFMASDGCFEREAGRALERHAAGEARVIPILLRPTDWRTPSLAALEALPRDARPVTTWPNRDAAFLDIVQGLRRVIEQIRPPAPDYPNPETRERSRALEDAYERRAELEAAGESTREIDAAIVALKRQLREDGHLKEGDFLDGRFRLQQLIGQGGFAQVWKAYDLKRRALVAVKVLHTQYGRDQSRRDRFFRGARQMARLRDHPGVVNVLEERCRDSGYHFFVMEYVSGGDFRQAVLEARLTPGERLAVVLVVGEALCAAHEFGIVHRDVKPANILLGHDGRPKLTDFDLVRAADTTGGTRTSMLGTFLYAAPEAMMDAKQASEPADVYGLGMTALFALHGADLPADVLWELPEFVAELDVGAACRTALGKAVARKVDRRWGTVTEFCEALRGALEQAEEESLPPPAVEQSRLETPAPVLEPTASPRERVHEQDGSVLVFVPGGRYVLGADDVDEDSRPVHTVELGPFWIGKHPVTNEQYRRFIAATGHREPEYWTNERFNAPLQPVVGVSWEDAKAYCAWASLELPSEGQWEAAARGTDGRRYTWGKDQPRTELADYGKDFDTDKPDDVGSHPQGAGPHGTQDQAGGVWEWCEDVWNSDAYDDRDGQSDPVGTVGEAAARVVRGGSWADEARGLPAAFRFRDGAVYRDQDLGFRVLCRSGPEP